MKTSSKGLAAYVVAYLLFLYLPIALIPLFSFNASIQAAFPLKGFTLDWYRALFGNEALRAAFLNSLGIALTSATLATVAGVTIAYQDLRVGAPLSRLISGAARLPILVPGVIMGIALLILVNMVGPGPSRGAIILGHTLLCLPTTTVILAGRFASIPRSVPEAASDLGAREAEIFRRVMLPMSWPAIASAFTLSFLISFDEFVVAFFLAGTERTLPLYIWSQLRFPKSLPVVMALGTMVLAASLVLATLAEFLRRSGRPSEAGKGARS